MFESNCKAEAVLYYLYMMADGEVSSGEEKLFDEICKELNLDTDEKNSVIERCREFAPDKTDALNIMVREKIDKQAGEGGWGLKNASDLARIIWNLVNLGYADTFYSAEEKKIVNYLVDKWSVGSEVYQELIDTADTMLALTKQREWVTRTFTDDIIKVQKEKGLDIKIKQLLDDVKLTIQELTM